METNGGDHVRRPEALDDRVGRGIGADHRHRAECRGVEGEEVPGVLQQDGRPLGRGEGEGGVRRRGDGRAGSTRRRPADEAVGEHLGQYPLDVAVHRGLGQQAPGHEIGQLVDRRRLEQVDARRERGRRRVDGAEVGAHEPGEAPLVEDEAERGVLALEHPVELRVRAHQRGDVRRGDGGLERRQVDLLQRPGRDVGVEGAPVGLLLVGEEVLGVGHHALGLQSPDVRHAELPR